MCYYLKTHDTIFLKVHESSDQKRIFIRQTIVGSYPCENLFHS